MLKPIVIRARVDVLGVCQLADLPQALKNFRVDKRRRYGAEFDAFVDFVVCFRPVLVIGELPQDEFIACCLESFRRTGIFVAGPTQTERMFASEW
jgi:hypothetical protein